jgi:zinc protease
MKALFALVALAGLCLLPIATLRPQPIPLSPDVKYGRLPNGLTYYVQKNQRPQKRAEIRLAVYAGSVLEDDDQQGLAHFVEHMVFEGTESFPGNAVDNYLQSIGVQFGPHLNAYTSFDETVYMIQTPTDMPEYLPKSLHILEEWLGKATFLDEEVEPERKIVIEEWRLGLGAEDRMDRATREVRLNGSRFARRDPIGTIEVLRTFPKERAIQFYRDWYRPDLAAVVVVGDVDPEATVREIEKRFSGIKNPARPRERKVYDVEFYTEARAAVATDPEAPNATLSIEYKKPHRPIQTENDLRRYMTEKLVVEMLTSRMDDYRLSAEPPFVEAYAYTWNFGKSFDSFVQICVAGEKGVVPALRAAAQEHRRIAQAGFTAGELERAKAALLNAYETAYRERAKTESSAIIDEYVYHFLEGMPAPGPTYYYEFSRKHLPRITLEEVNAAAREWFNTPDCVVVVKAPESLKSQIPQADELLFEYRKAGEVPIEAYQEKDLSLPIVVPVHPPGKIVLERPIAEIGAVEWKLSNGATVLLKPTDFKDDEVCFRAYSPGGYSLHGHDLPTATQCAEAVRYMGAGNYNAADLSRKLAGKTADLHAYIHETHEGMKGRFAPKDAETFFELVHAAFARPRRDEQAFEAWKQRQIAQLLNAAADPQKAFHDTVVVVSHNYHPLVKILGVQDYQKFHPDSMLKAYRERFADASDFVFVMVGKFDPQELKKGVEKYLASLPGQNRRESWKDLGIRPPTGKLERTVYKGAEEQAMVFWMKTGPFSWTVEDTVQMYAVQTTLDLMFTESMRKQSGGTYGTHVSLKPVRYPVESFAMKVHFGCAPENVQKLVRMAENDVKTLCENGPSDLDATKTVETLKREAEVKLKENDYWADKIEESYRYGLDVRRIPEVARYYNSIDKSTIQRAAQRYFSQTHEALVVRLPARN